MFVYIRAFVQNGGLAAFQAQNPQINVVVKDTSRAVPHVISTYGKLRMVSLMWYWIDIYLNWLCCGWLCRVGSAEQALADQWNWGGHGGTGPRLYELTFVVDLILLSIPRFDALFGSDFHRLSFFLLEIVRSAARFYGLNTWSHCQVIHLGFLFPCPECCKMNVHYPFNWYV